MFSSFLKSWRRLWGSPTTQPSFFWRGSNKRKQRQHHKKHLAKFLLPKMQGGREGNLCTKFGKGEGAKKKPTIFSKFDTHTQRERVHLTSGGIQHPSRGEDEHEQHPGDSRRLLPPRMVHGDDHVLFFLFKFLKRSSFANNWRRGHNRSFPP